MLKILQRSIGAFLIFEKLVSRHSMHVYHKRPFLCLEDKDLAYTGYV